MSNGTKIEPLEASFSSVWMLQPVYGSFRHALESKGYTLKDLSTAGGPSITLATKGSVEIFTIIERRVIGIRSETSTSDLLAAHKDLKQIYEELAIEASNVMFYEFVGDYILTSARNPLKTMCTLKLEKDILRKIGTVLNKDLAMLGLNLSVRNGNPTSSEWFWLVVEPLYVSASKKYHLRVIYRGKEGELVDFINGLEKKAIKMIDELEGSV